MDPDPYQNFTDPQTATVPKVRQDLTYICHLIIVGTGTGAAGVVAGQAVQRVVGLALHNIFDSNNNPEYFILDLRGGVINNLEEER